MDTVVIILLFLFVILLGVAVLAGIGYGLWKIPYVGKYLCLLATGWFIFSLYTAIWPPNSFYFEEMKYHANIDLLERAEVVDKSASYPDFHGDYYSQATFEVSTFSESEISPEYRLSSCEIPPYIKSKVGDNHKGGTCWFIQKEIDQRLSVAYFKELGLLHYHYYQH
ncbi:hypothetical protein A9Q79_01365 [Methylophaga sp. 42_25_T18]|nr:hypothetical protein A9Q79_01365 [Methylophaga sp. 42_25_T18]